MLTKECRIEFCNKPSKCRDLCATHYTRWYRHGDALIIKINKDLTDEERFWEKVNKNGPISTYRPDLGPCWLWEGLLDKHGYGIAYRPSTKTKKKGNIGAHRKSYILINGAVGDNLDIDHLCRVHACVNPNHLEPVTHRENILRGENFAAQQVRRTECPYGHPYYGENLYVNPNNGQRKCRECMRRRDRIRRPRKASQLV